MDRASSKSHFRITVRVGTRDLGVFDTLSGGETSADITKRRGGTSPSKRANLGGPRDVSDITVSREHIASRDESILRALRPQCGVGECIVTRQPLDQNRQPYGRPEVNTGGTLKSVSGPEADSDSADTSMLQLVISAGDWA